MFTLIHTIGKKHKYKIIFGAPIIFALFMNIDADSLPGNTFSMQTENSKFIEVGQQVNFTTNIHANNPVNVAASTIAFPQDLCEVNKMAHNESIVDLWIEEPTYSNELGIISFGGGMLASGGFVGDGHLFFTSFTPTLPGEINFTFESPALLAHDGKGTNVVTLTGTEGVTFHVRKIGTPSPDLNDDNVITMADVNTLYFNIFKPYNPRYDLNSDKRVSFSDLKILFSLFTS